MRVIDLFSGIGGFSLAAHWMGWKTIAFVERDLFCKMVLQKNFGSDIPIYDDVKTFPGKKYRGECDIITGGFPCQDISTANRFGEGIKGLRSGLWREYARIIREVRPSFVVFENSPMLVRRGFERVLCDLSRLGYDAEWRSFYASQYGFRHYRKRIYGLAYTHGVRRQGCIDKESVLSKILPGRPPGQASFPVPSERVDGSSNFRALQPDDGFSTKLDKNSIRAFGNAIVPQIALEIFRAIDETWPVAR